jgi:hypothetical protein
VWRSRARAPRAGLGGGADALRLGGGSHAAGAARRGGDESAPLLPLPTRLHPPMQASPPAHPHARGVLPPVSPGARAQTLRAVEPPQRQPGAAAPAAATQQPRPPAAGAPAALWSSPEAALRAAEAAAAALPPGAPPPPASLRVSADCGAPGADATLVSLLESEAACAALAALRLSGAAAGGVGGRIAAAALRRCRGLRALRLTRCAFDGAAWARLAAAAGDAPALEELEAEACSLSGERALAALAGAVRTSATLRALNLAGNAALGDAGIGTLCGALGGGASLEALVLAGCGLGEPAARALAALLALPSAAAEREPGCRLRALDLGRNPRLGAAGGAALLDALAVNGCLEALILDGCGLTAAVARPLAAGLRENGALRVLDVSDNGLTDGALTPSLAAALWDNRTLTSLDLSGNGIGDEGAAELARGLSRNTALLTLRLARNAALGAAALAALRAAAGRPTLQVVTHDEE